MKKTKFGISWFLGLILSGMVLIIAIVVAIDPFFQYHKPLEGGYYLIDNQLSQNPGMAKNFTYDSVILGSSMTVNFDTELFRDEMGLNTIKLCYNGAYPKDQDNILKIIGETHPDIKSVFLGIDVMSYAANPEETKYPVPEYLYDKNILNDVSYWFNKDVWFDYIIKPMLKKESTKLSEAYDTWTFLTFSKESALANYQAPTQKSDSVPYDEYEKRVIYNMETYIIPHIEDNPDTTFYIFFPPYSMLYWYEQIMTGDLDAEMYQYQTIMELLFSYSNVKVFYFQNQYEYISDLDHYADYFHYEPGMNDKMTQCFATGEFEVTKENYKNVLDEMKEYILGYDYHAILEE